MIRFLLKERIAEKEFNEKRRITLDEISRETDISRHTLSRMQNKFGYNTTTDNLDRLCKFFDCEIAKLVERVSGQ